MTIFGFISDTLFHRRISVDLENGVDMGVGYATDRLVNYFDKIARISDNRSERLSIVGVPAVGDIQFLIDKNKLEDSTVFEDLNDNALTQLFNIIETLYLSQGKTENELDALLMSGEGTAIYVQESVQLSSFSNQITVKIGENYPELRISNWVSFTVAVAETELKFKLWLSRDAFLADYPLTTITKIIPPCQPAYLLEPDKFANEIDAVIKSTSTIMEMLNTELQKSDNTGLLMYNTKYQTGSQSVYQLPFGILYKGAKPVSLEIRKAIREYLLSQGLAPQTTWEALLPDLFVVGQFFIVPMWGNTTVRPDRILYPSIINLKSMLDKAGEVFIGVDEEFLSTHSEVLDNGHDEMFSIVVPDLLNDVTKMSVQALHPTYQRHMAQSPGFAYQEVHTKEFNTRLNQCLTVLAGESSSTLFASNSFFNRRFLSFVVDSIEYHVLYKEDFELPES